MHLALNTQEKIHEYHLGLLLQFGYFPKQLTYE